MYRVLTLSGEVGEVQIDIQSLPSQLQDNLSVGRVAKVFLGETLSMFI